MATAEELAERLFGSHLGLIDVLAVYLGDRLGWYRSLVDDGPATAPELARRTGTHARYAREWLEQQAVTGYLTLDRGGEPDERVFSIPPATAEVMTDTASLNYLAPLARMFAATGPALPLLLDAYRTGGGVSWEQLGADARESQADGNRPWYDARLAAALAGVSDLHEALARPGARILDVGAGGAWSTIALARAYPDAEVTALDIDLPSVEMARANAAAAGVALRGPPRGRRRPRRGVVRRRLRVRVHPRHGPARGGAGIHPPGAGARRLPGRDGRGRGGDLRPERRRGRAPDVRLQPAHLPARRDVAPAQRRHRHRDAAVGAACLRRGGRLRPASEILPIEDFGFWRFYRLTPG